MTLLIMMAPRATSFAGKGRAAMTDRIALPVVGNDAAASLHEERMRHFR